MKSTSNHTQAVSEVCIYGSGFGYGLFSAAAAMLLAFTGCGSESRIPVFPVEGKVAFQGKPPVGAQVVLHLVNGLEGSDGVAPSGTVAENGAFNITSYDPGDGAPQGEYVATISWFKYSPGLGGAGPNVIPPKYSSAKTSPIKVSVNSGPTQIQPIVIK